MRRLLLFALVGSMLSATACGPPEPPLDVGVREYQTDVTLHDAEDPSLDDPLVALLPLFALAPPPYTDEPDAIVSTPGTCRELGADRSSGEVPDTVTEPPAESTYVYGVQDGAAPEAAGSSAAAELTIRGIEPTAETFAYQIVAEQAGSVTRNRYERRDEGLFLTHAETHASDGSRDAFNPVPALQLLPFPTEPGRQWQARGVDPHTGRTVTFDGEVVGRVAVDACGVAIDAWEVRLTSGSIGAGSAVRGQGGDSGSAQADPAADEEPDADTGWHMAFEARMAFAPQHGGLLVRSELNAGAAEGQATTRIMTITSEPGAASRSEVSE